MGPGHDRIEGDLNPLFPQLFAYRRQFQRIDPRAIDPHAKVEMWAGRPSRRTDEPNDLPLADLLVRLNQDLIEMKVHALNPSPMIDHHGQPGKKMVTGQCHLSMIHRLDRGPPIGP
jgi:hypothetical protein